MKPDSSVGRLDRMRWHSSGNGPISYLLEHHLRRYSTRNNADFFVHKDLSGFLNRELDFYLKNEVLNLDNLADGRRKTLAEGLVPANALGQGQSVRQNHRLLGPN